MFHQPTGGGVTTTVTVTVDGTTTNYSYNNSPITFQVKAESSYTVSFASIDYHNTPSQQTFTAVKNYSRAITADYTEVIYGCYCVDSNMVLWKKENWQSSNNAIGVALINDNVSLIIALDEWHCRKGSNPKYGHNCSAWGGQGKNLSITDTADMDYSDILLDYNGKNWTSIMNSELVSTNYNDSRTSYGSYTGSPAAEYCIKYSTTNTSAGDWFLGAFGQWYQVVLNKDELNECLSACGGTQFTYGNFDDSDSSSYYQYATSSEGFESRCMVASFDPEYTNNDNDYINNTYPAFNNIKYRDYIIRPFTDYNL